MCSICTIFQPNSSTPSSDNELINLSPGWIFVIHMVYSISCVSTSSVSLRIAAEGGGASWGSTVLRFPV